MTRKMSLGNVIGFIVGGILMLPTDPATIAIGIAMVAYNAYSMGWLGK